MNFNQYLSYIPVFLVFFLKLPTAFSYPDYNEMLQTIENHLSKKESSLQLEQFTDQDKKARKRRMNVFENLKTLVENLKENKIQKSEFLNHLLEERFKCLRKVINLGVIQSVNDQNEIWSHYYQSLNLLIYQSLFIFKQQGGSEYFRVGFFQEKGSKNAAHLLSLSGSLLNGLTGSQEDFINSTKQFAPNEYENYEKFLKKEPIQGLFQVENVFQSILKKSRLKEEEFISRIKKILKIQILFYEENIMNAQAYINKSQTMTIENLSDISSDIQSLKNLERDLHSLKLDEINSTMELFSKLLLTRFTLLELFQQNDPFDTLFQSISQLAENGQSDDDSFWKKFISKANEFDSYQVLNDFILSFLLFFKEKYGLDFNSFINMKKYESTHWYLRLSAITLKDFYYGKTENSGKPEEAYRKGGEREYAQKILVNRNPAALYQLLDPSIFNIDSVNEWDNTTPHLEVPLQQELSELNTHLEEEKDTFQTKEEKFEQ